MRRVFVLVAAATAIAAVAGSVPPPVLSWQEAGAHTGEIVTLDGEVRHAFTTGDTCVLEFDPENPRAFRVVLLLPLLSDLPPHPERLYQSRRVRVSGRVQRFQGRAEMVLKNPGQIEVVDVASVAPPVAATAPSAPVVAAPSAVVRSSDAPPAPPSVPPAPAAAAVAVPAVAAPAAVPPAAAPPETPPAAPPPRGLVEAIGRQVGSEAACSRAQGRWRDAGTVAAERAAALSRCLAAGSYHCRAESAALAPALSTLEGAEQQVETSCP